MKRFQVVIIGIVLLTVLIMLSGCKKKDKTAPTKTAPKTAVNNNAAEKSANPTPAPIKNNNGQRYDITGMDESQLKDTLQPNAVNSDETVIVQTRNQNANRDCGANGCEIGELQTAQKKSETVKGMLRKIPVIGNGTASAENSAPSLLGGDAGNYNEIKLPGSGHSEMKSNGKNNLWPGGIPLEAEVAPEIMDF